MAGTAFYEILGDCGSVKCCIFQYKMGLQDGTSEVDNDFILGLSSNCFYIGGNK